MTITRDRHPAARRTKAIAEIRACFPDNSLEFLPERSGWLFVTLRGISLGPPWAQPDTWISFQITFQYPYADVYPHFVRHDLSRADGKPFGPGLGVAHSAASQQSKFLAFKQTQSRDGYGKTQTLKGIAMASITVSPWRLILPAKIKAELFAHLFRDDHDEHGAIILAGICQSERGLKIGGSRTPPRRGWRGLCSGPLRIPEAKGRIHSKSYPARTRLEARVSGNT